MTENAEAHILLVDDDDALRTIIAMALESVAIVTAVESVEAAIAQLADRLPDLIVTDVMMPGANGLEFCRGLRQQDRTRDIPVLVMTGDDTDDLLSQAYDAGATDFVAKPVGTSVLQHRVRYLLRSGAAFRAQREARSRLAAAHRIAGLGHWEYVESADAFRWSDELFRVFAIRRRETVTAEEWLAGVHPKDASRVAECLGAVAAGREPAPIDYRVVREDGSARYVHQQARFPTVGDDEQRRIGTVQDVTERKEAEAKIRFLAFRDVLTGLPNRRLFGDRLGRAVERARRNAGRVAVLHLDIDRFKSINEGFGQAFGDTLLQQVSQRLASCLRASDTVARAHQPGDPTLSRLGGDEFMLVLPDLTAEQEPGAIATRLTEALSKPFHIGDTELLVTCGIGIAVYPEDGDDAQQLVRSAETALGQAKAHGGNRALFFSERMNTDAAARLSLASRLHHGLQREEFSLVYQPIFDTTSRRVTGLEALMRWDQPDHGPGLPSEFVPVAEETGLILPLGRWVLNRACEQWRRWLDDGIGPVQININVSARQFGDPGFVADVEEIIQRHAVEPSFLCFEITEGVLMNPNNGTIETTEALREIGIGLAVDDFGTGYSSLSYLRRFPTQTLKIDRSFVQGVPEDPESCSLVSAIIAVASKLRLRVVAEGIENDEQLRFLEALDCDAVQGYMLGEPASPAHLEPLLRRRLHRSPGSSVLPFRKRLAS